MKHALLVAFLLGLLEKVDARSAGEALNLKNLQYSNLQGKGPMMDVEETLRFQEVTAVDGAQVDMVITSDEDYTPSDVSSNGVFHQEGNSMGVVNLKVGTVANLQVSFFEKGTMNPKVVPKFFFSVFDLERRSASEEERLKIKGFHAVYLTKETRLGFKHTPDGTLFKPVGNVFREVKDPADVLLLSAEQRAHTVTFLFQDTSTFSLSIECTSESPSGGAWNFLFGSATNAPTYAYRIPLSYLEDDIGDAWQSSENWLKILGDAGNEDDTDSGIDHAGGVAFFREPDLTTCTCNLDLTYVKINNLGGLGPDMDSGRMIRYGDVCTVDGRLVDLVIEDVGGYASTDVRSNGRSTCGPYGSISVEFGTMVHLQARFLEADSNTYVRMPDFFFTIFDMDLSGAHEEKVTIHGFKHQFMSPDTLVSQEEVMNGHVFTSPTVVSGVECPSDPVDLTTAQSNVAVTVLFSDVSEFSFSLEVIGAAKHRSHSFLFGGTSSVNTDCSGHGLPTTTSTASTSTASTTTETTVTSTTTIDCEGHLASDSWSEDEREICCNLNSQFCSTTTTTTMSRTSTTTTSITTLPPFDCTDGSSSQWPQNKSAWCCEKYNEGCTTTTTTTTRLEAFNCSLLEPKRWSSEKREWCCEEHGKGCSLVHEKPAPASSTITTTPYTGCGEVVTCELKLTDVIHDNLSGKGPDKIEPRNLRYGNACVCEHGAIDLVITADRSYEPFIISDNGRSTRGPYGVISVALGTTVDLQATFMLAGTDSLASVTSVLFSLFGLHQQSPGHKEVVTIYSFDSFNLSASSFVDYERIPNGAIFKSTSSGDSLDVPSDPMSCTAEQERTSASVLFKEVSSFNFTLAVTGEPVDGGRDFLFGGRSCITEHCSTRSTSESARPASKSEDTTTLTSATDEDQYSCLDENVDKWNDAQRAWCCSHESIACADPYDCKAGYINWQLGWSAVKKTWCCSHKKRGCESTTTSSAPYKCTIETPGDEGFWPMDKQKWCCKNERVGCEMRASSATPYDCKAGYASWKIGWSNVKKDWCCQHEDRGCRFHCDVAYNNWEVAWSDQKKHWCCQYEHRACRIQQTESTEDDAYDCNAGIEHWKLGWAHKKKEWCCRTKRVGCEKTSLQLGIDQWNPFDCDTGYATWEASWDHPQRQWCCANYGRACKGTTQEPFDCKSGFEAWRTRWKPAQQEWCCHNYNRGCAGIARKYEQAPHGAGHDPGHLPLGLAAPGVVGALALGLGCLVVASRLARLPGPGKWSLLWGFEAPARLRAPTSTSRGFCRSTREEYTTLSQGEPGPSAAAP